MRRKTSLEGGGYFMWFVDKLGPAPGAAAQPTPRPNGAATNQASQPAAAKPQQAPVQPASAAKAAPPPEPEKKKKKGWF